MLCLLVFMISFTPCNAEEHSLFGVAAVADHEDDNDGYADCLPEGLTEVGLGMKRKEVETLRRKYQKDKSKPWLQAEMNGEDVPVDRVHFRFSGPENGLSEIWMYSEYGSPSRENLFNLVKSLYRTYGKPNHVFDLKEGRDIGMQWLKGTSGVTLVLRADPLFKPTVDIWIEDAGELAQDTPLKKMIQDGKKEVPEDFLAYLNGFLDRAFGQK